MCNKTTVCCELNILCSLTKVISLDDLVICDWITYAIVNGSVVDSTFDTRFETNIVKSRTCAF